MKCTTCCLAICVVLAASPCRDSGALGFVMPRRITSNHALCIKTPSATSTWDNRECHRPAARCRARMSFEDSSGGNGGSSAGGGGVGGGGLQSEGSGALEDGGEEPKSLASLVESTFVMAASANNYAEGLKAFIRVVKEAYERGYTVPALTMEVSFVPTKTAGRDLYADEVELRSIWIALIYLTLEQANWPQKVPRAHEISPQFMDRFAVFVTNVMAASAKGHTLQTLKLEEVMRRAEEPRTPMESAVLSQSMRIVFTTIDLMKEGWTG